jgi:alpha-glucosidase
LLRGTPVIYYGDEIGMKNIRINRKKLQDPLGKKYWPFYSGRDKARTPMQWNNSFNAGFTTGIPWLPVGENYSTCNVDDELKDKKSLLNFYRKLIALRIKYPVLQEGSYKPVQLNKHSILAFYRQHKKQEILVVVNFKWYPVRIDREDIEPLKIILSTHRNNRKWIGKLQVRLNPYEVLVLKLQ